MHSLSPFLKDNKARAHRQTVTCFKKSAILLSRNSALESATLAAYYYIAPNNRSFSHFAVTERGKKKKEALSYATYLAEERTGPKRNLGSRDDKLHPPSRSVTGRQWRRRGAGEDSALHDVTRRRKKRTARRSRSHRPLQDRAFRPPPRATRAKKAADPPRQRPAFATGPTTGPRSPPVRLGPSPRRGRRARTSAAAGSSTLPPLPPSPPNSVSPQLRLRLASGRSDAETAGGGGRSVRIACVQTRCAFKRTGACAKPSRASPRARRGLVEGRTASDGSAPPCGPGGASGHARRA